MRTKSLTIGHLAIQLAEEKGGIRVTSDYADNIILPNQDLASVEEIVKKNFQIVAAYYCDRINDSIDLHDIQVVSLKIVLHYLYMYNMWRTIYNYQKDRDLKFLSEDFDHPATHDLIIGYFKEKYPEDYSIKCGTMLGMSGDELKKYEKKRQEFYDIF